MAKHFLKTLFIFLIIVVLGIVGVYFLTFVDEGSTFDDLFGMKEQFTK